MKRKPGFSQGTSLAMVIWNDKKRAGVNPMARELREGFFHLPPG